MHEKNTITNFLHNKQYLRKRGVRTNTFSFWGKRAKPYATSCLPSNQTITGTANTTTVFGSRLSHLRRNKEKHVYHNNISHRDMQLVGDIQAQFPYYSKMVKNPNANDNSMIVYKFVVTKYVSGGLDLSPVSKDYDDGYELRENYLPNKSPVLKKKKKRESNGENGIMKSFQFFKWQ